MVQVLQELDLQRDGLELRRRDPRQGYLWREEAGVPPASQRKGGMGERKVSVGGWAGLRPGGGRGGRFGVEVRGTTPV